MYRDESIKPKLSIDANLNDGLCFDWKKGAAEAPACPHRKTLKQMWRASSRGRGEENSHPNMHYLLLLGGHCLIQYACWHCNYCCCTMLWSYQKSPIPIYEKTEVGGCEVLTGRTLCYGWLRHCARKSGGRITIIWGTWSATLSFTVANKSHRWILLVQMEYSLLPSWLIQVTVLQSRSCPWLLQVGIWGCTAVN